LVSLYAGVVDAGAAPHRPGDGGIGLRNLNAITPENATTSHYFWAIAQDRAPPPMNHGLTRSSAQSLPLS